MNSTQSPSNPVDFKPQKNPPSDDTLPPHPQVPNQICSQQFPSTQISQTSDHPSPNTYHCLHQSHLPSPICTNCGVYFTQNPLRCGIKTPRYHGSSWSLSHLRLTSPRFQPKQVPPLTSRSKDALQKASAYFGWTLQTQALGLYIAYTAFQNQNQFLEVTTSLFLAAKLLEHTPSKFLRKYRRYLNKSFSLEEYQRMEECVLTKMGFNLMVPTFMDFIGCYLYQGIGTEGETGDVGSMEDALVEMARAVLYGPSGWMEGEPELVASTLLYEVRMGAGVKEVWNKTIQGITGLTIRQNFEDENINDSHI